MVRLLRDRPAPYPASSLGGRGTRRSPRKPLRGRRTSVSARSLHECVRSGPVPRRFPAWRLAEFVLLIGSPCPTLSSSKASGFLHAPPRPCGARIAGLDLRLPCFTRRWRGRCAGSNSPQCSRVGAPPKLEQASHDYFIEPASPTTAWRLALARSAGPSQPSRAGRVFNNVC